MTDKQIIVDGVDVSRCGFYHSNGECCTSRVWEGYCKDCRKCMYKLDQQLKRKEQECETLASQLDFEVQKKECLEQECERLKETLKVIANRPCLNINDCNGNCLPHCKWNAHKLAQKALKELE